MRIWKATVALGNSMLKFCISQLICLDTRMVEIASGNCLSDTHSGEILSQETQKIRFAKADPMHVRVHTASILFGDF
jgi:hypothetical protein